MVELTVVWCGARGCALRRPTGPTSEWQVLLLPSGFAISAVPRMRLVSCDHFSKETSSVSAKPIDVRPLLQENVVAFGKVDRRRRQKSKKAHERETGAPLGRFELAASVTIFAELA
jgi:hypothetical protein